jgi:hypothetical protein
MPINFENSDNSTNPNQSAIEQSAVLHQLFINASGDKMSGDLDMNTNRIVNVSDPNQATDAVNKSYMDKSISSSILNLETKYFNMDKAEKLSFDLDMNKNRITNLKDPVNDSDSVNKSYVDKVILDIQNKILTDEIILNTGSSFVKIMYLKNISKGIIFNVFKKEDINPHSKNYSIRAGVKLIDYATNEVIPSTSIKYIYESTNVNIEYIGNKSYSIVQAKVNILISYTQVTLIEALLEKVPYTLVINQGKSDFIVTKIEMAYTSDMKFSTDITADVFKGENFRAYYTNKNYILSCTNVKYFGSTIGIYFRATYLVNEL